MDKTPEQVRDATVAKIIKAGGVVYQSLPMANASDPSIVVAYVINAGSPARRVQPAVQAVQEATEVDLSGLVAWVDPTVQGVSECFVA